MVPVSNPAGVLAFAHSQRCSCKQPHPSHCKLKSVVGVSLSVHKQWRRRMAAGPTLALRKQAIAAINARLARLAEPPCAKVSPGQEAINLRGVCSRAGSSVTASTRGGGFRRTLIATGKHRRPRWGAWRGSRRQAHARHQRRQTLHEFQRRDPDARGLVEPGTLQLQHDVTRRIFLARWDHLNNKVSPKPKAAPTAVSPPYSHSIINGASKPLSRIERFSVSSISTVKSTVI